MEKKQKKVKKVKSSVNSAVKPLQIQLYNLLEKPRWYVFSKEGGIVKKLLKRYSPEDISYTIKYSTEILKIKPKSFSWLVNNEDRLVKEALSYREKINKASIETVKIFEEKKNRATDSIPDYREEKPIDEKKSAPIYKKIFGL